MNRKRKPKGRKNDAGIIFIFLGIGIVIVNIFPANWMLVILSVALVAAGVIITKC